MGLKMKLKLTLYRKWRFAIFEHGNELDHAKTNIISYHMPSWSESSLDAQVCHAVSYLKSSNDEKTANLMLLYFLSNLV